MQHKTIVLWKEILSVFSKVEQLILSIFCIIFMKCIFLSNILNNRNSGSLMNACVCSVCASFIGEVVCVGEP